MSSGDLYDETLEDLAIACRGDGGSGSVERLPKRRATRKRCEELRDWHLENGQVPSWQQLGAGLGGRSFSQSHAIALEQTGEDSVETESPLRGTKHVYTTTFT